MYIHATSLLRHSEADIRAANPNTSFGTTFVAPDDYALVFPAPQPTYSTLTQVVREITPTLTAKGHWEQQWEVVPRFVEYTDDALVLHTVAEQEAKAIADSLVAAKSELILRIKAEANDITKATIGELGNEYQQARDDANAFKAAGYAPPVPSSVSSWATAKGWTAKQACDDILVAAAGWLAAQEAIRANRLARTEATKVCTTQAALDAVTAQWAAFASSIRAQLGLS